MTKITAVSMLLLLSMLLSDALTTSPTPSKAGKRAKAGKKTSMSMSVAKAGKSVSALPTSGPTSRSDYEATIGSISLTTFDGMSLPLSMSFSG